MGHEGLDDLVATVSRSGAGGSGKVAYFKAGDIYDDCFMGAAGDNHTAVITNCCHGRRGELGQQRLTRS